MATESNALPTRPGRRNRRAPGTVGAVEPVTSSAGRRRVASSFASRSLRGHYPDQVRGVDEVPLVLSAGAQLPLPNSATAARALRVAKGRGRPSYTRVVPYAVESSYERP